MARYLCQPLCWIIPGKFPRFRTVVCKFAHKSRQIVGRFTWSHTGQGLQILPFLLEYLRRDQLGGPMHLGVGGLLLFQAAAVEDGIVRIQPVAQEIALDVLYRTGISQYRFSDLRLIPSCCAAAIPSARPSPDTQTAAEGSKPALHFVTGNHSMI